TPLSKPAYSENGYFSFLSSDTQRIHHRIDDREASMKKKRTNTGSRAPSRDDLTSTYTELNIRKVERLTNAQTDGLDPTYSQLNLRQNEVLIAKEEDPPLASGRGSQAAAHDQQSKVKIGNRPYRLICLLCLVTFALIVIVAGFSIHVSQFRHQFTEMETKCRSINETKAQICEFLTSRRVQNCSENWIRNNDRCYYVSTLQTNFSRAIQECSNRDSSLLEINSRDEASFVSNNLVYKNLEYWIGKCEDGNVSSGLLYKGTTGTPPCRLCDPTAVRPIYPCDLDQPFICEKSVHLCPQIPEKIQGLCQQPVEAT
ncbi:killer cell lectin-like receptor subfamily B member 1, partial [Hypanus sabinus]|uniref:killer cell lectin-like receptor subfamily B member 1 n=1 Tax=Hypanus sabinus TaxID=79690 RepID=UPI0028C4E0B5